MGTKFYDTNALIELQEKIFDEYFVISSQTLVEIENIKTSNNKSDDVKFKARSISRLLNAHIDQYSVHIVTLENYDILKEFDLPVTPDNLIASSAYLWQKNNGIVDFYTYDNNLRLIAKSIFHLNIFDFNDIDNIEEYIGYKDVIMSDDEMAYFYEHLEENIYDLLINEYLIIRNKNNEIVEKRKWDGESYILLKYKSFENDWLGKIKPINTEQELAFDMLQDTNITIKTLAGVQGSGKSFITIAHILQQLKKGKKIMWVRNTIEVNNTKPIGFLPNDKTSKLLPFAGTLLDYCGGVDGLNRLMNDASIEIEHLGFMRGRNLVDTCLIVNEAENITKEHLQLLISRIGKGSSLWLDGDLLQIDSNIFVVNNGLKAAIEKLKGQKLFGYVKLKECERSETAKLAELLN